MDQYKPANDSVTVFRLPDESHEETERFVDSSAHKYVATGALSLIATDLELRVRRIVTTKVNASFAFSLQFEMQSARRVP